MSKYEKVMFCVMLALATFSSSEVYAQARNQLTGQVVDKDNRPVAGVSVTIKRGAEVLDKQRTNKDGRYVLKFFPGGYISTVLYECLDCYACVIFNLSGSKDHNITKVIVKKGSQLSVNEYSEIRATLEYLANSADIPQAERERYANSARTLPPPIITPFSAPASLPLMADVVVGVLLDQLSAKETQKGYQFSVLVLKPSEYEDAVIGGEVTRVKKESNSSSITIRFDSITMPDGKHYQFGGTVKEVVLPHAKGVDSGGASGTGSSKDNELVVRRYNSVAGALIGAAIMEPHGASMGAAIGASAATTSEIEAPRGELKLAAGAKLIISVDKDLIVKQQLAAAAPTSTNFLGKARELYAAGHDDEALMELRNALRVDPMNAEAYLLTGRIYMRRGEIAPAISQLKAAIFWDSERKLIDAHILLGRIFLERGDRAQATAYMQSAIQIDPNNQEAIALQRQITTGIGHH